jgi:hypothetical protein
MWAFSFMKSDRAARFVNRQMHLYSVVGSLTYVSWPEFVTEFILEFCLKNEIQVARTNLETPKYFQGSKTVDEYVDEFHKMIDHGLNPKVQDHVACMTTGCPLDELPTQWYDAAILYNENRIANEAFMMASRTSSCPEPSSSGTSIFHRPTPRTPIVTPPQMSRYTPAAMSTSHPQRLEESSSIVCFWCGQSGHLHPECPKHFDVHFMDLDEQQALVQEEFVALDVATTEARLVDEEIGKEKEGFGDDNE